MSYRYGIYDLTGRLWIRTLTAIRAARLVERLRVERGLVCQVRAL